MTIVFHKDFRKSYRKSHTKVRKQFDDRLRVFKVNEFDPILNNHALKGKWQGYRSINVSGDIRAVFKRESDTVLFVAIDTHSNLYS